ncbi:type II toxin-antitoxin system RelE/ParE family toxin [Colwellia sp. 12G3]|uniref:type II toxin-antitoxin system RelE/ParE family toxin n=1 Tax=Colwellia sp. 12G3 TaxID=2058299 RepID=UPI000C32D846|nr:type II toxin-antitoxin system RelE/ParE family toxin [Colwellia sp. 12G3]PKI17463.1 type II toxin-antitoxin system RelE/ParE family toxin [Colwellia sp. 12G3]
MLLYKFTQDARADLLNIRKYTLKTWEREQSTKYLQELKKTLQLLSDSPSIGIQRTDISLTTFSFPYVSHIIYYTLDNNYLIVFAVLHKNMVPEKHIANRKHQ